MTWEERIVPKKLLVYSKVIGVLQATKIEIPPKHQRQVININKFKDKLIFHEDKMQNALRIGNIHLKKGIKNRKVSKMTNKE